MTLSSSLFQRATCCVKSSVPLTWSVTTRVILFLLTLLGSVSVHAARENISTGGTAAYPLSITWAQYTKTPYVGGVVCSTVDAGCYNVTGLLTYTFRLDTSYPTSLIGSGFTTIPASGTAVHLSFCVNIGVTCSYRNVVPGLTCTPADRGLFFSCLRSRNGNVYTVQVPYSETAVLPRSRRCARFVLSAASASPSPNDSSVQTEVLPCSDGSPSVIPDPEPVPVFSTCSLSNQRLDFIFVSNSLSMASQSRTSSLLLSCTAGAARDYQLRLTGSLVNGGRLDFGNGVSAMISVNNIPLPANGTGVRLNAQTSGSMTISADLAGVSSSPGVFTSSGILILDAL